MWSLSREELRSCELADLEIRIPFRRKFATRCQALLYFVEEKVIPELMCSPTELDVAEIDELIEAVSKRLNKFRSRTERFQQRKQKLEGMVKK